LHMAQLIPLPLTVSCFSKIQIGFTFLVLAHLGSPGQRAVKRVCVRVCMRCGLLLQRWRGLSALPDTTVSPTKTDEPIEVTFGLCTRVGPKTYAVGGVWTPRERGILGGGFGGPL